MSTISQQRNSGTLVTPQVVIMTTCGATGDDQSAINIVSSMGDRIMQNS